MESTDHSLFSASHSPEFSREVLPSEPYKEAVDVWLALAGIESWGAWSKDIFSASHLDALPCGRGSRVRLNTSYGEEVWTVSYWLPGERLDLYREIGKVGILRRFELEDPPSGEGVKLVLSYHRQASAVRKIVFAPALYLSRLRALKFFSDLNSHLCGE